LKTHTYCGKQQGLIAPSKKVYTNGMPTPFTHLEISQRLLHETALSDDMRRLLNTHQADFLVGAVVADARPDGVKRADTHFYHYSEPMPDNPWREMFRQHPSLMQPLSPEHHAFLAGYVAHLAVDEYWSRYMMKPYFADGAWGPDIKDRFFALHLLLAHMDERDEQLLDSSVPTFMRQSQFTNWLPFLTDAALAEWRDFIAYQLETTSQTLDVFSPRVKIAADALRHIIDDRQQMQMLLWDNIPPTLLSRIEAEMYIFAHEQLALYLKL
jgi:hypothetical protein